LNGLEVSNTGVTSFQGQTGTVTLSVDLGFHSQEQPLTTPTQVHLKNIFKIITAGGTDITAGSNSDQLTFAAGSGLRLRGCKQQNSDNYE